MTFQIDTGTPQRAWNPLQIDRCGEIRAIAVDSLPEDATQAQIDGAIALAVMGDLHTPKRLDTVRRHLMALMPLIAELLRFETDYDSHPVSACGICRKSCCGKLAVY